MKKRLTQLTLKTKIILAILLSITIPLGLTTSFAMNDSEESLKREGFNKLAALTEMKERQVLQYFSTLEQDIVRYAQSKDIKYFWEKYREKDPLVIDDSRSHLINYQTLSNYPDLYLIDIKTGDLIFQATKKVIKKDELLHPGLIKLKERVVKNKKFSFVDFSQKNDKKGAFTAFVGAPILVKGTLVGVVAVEVSIKKINYIINQRVGLGESGETYLMAKNGNDYSFRSDMTTMGVGKYVIGFILKTPPTYWIDSVKSVEAKTGIYTDSIGNSVLISFNPIQFKFENIRWEAITKMDIDEFNKPMTTLKKEILIYASIILIIFLFIAFIFVSGINRGIKRVVSRIGDTILDIKQGRLQTKISNDGIIIDFQDVVLGVNGIIESFIKPIKLTSSYLDQISSGNIPEKITEEYPGDFNEIKDNVNNCIDVMNRLHQETDQLIVATQNGILDRRGDEVQFSGKWGDLIRSINHLIDAFVGPINMTAEYIDRISKGSIPPHITDHYKGDFNEIKNNFNNCIDVMNNLLGESSDLIISTQNGQLDKRGDATQFIGVWGILLGSINELIDAFVAPINMTAEYVDRISKGDIPPIITDHYKGDFNEIKNNLNGCIAMMNGLLQESGDLIIATQNGQLDKRGDSASFNGVWGILLGGINELIDGFVAPINMTAEYIDRISKGDIPPMITDEYKGDFNEIKNNFNGCIDVMNSMINETGSLILRIQSGELDKRGDTTRFIGKWGIMVGDINELIDAFVTPINMTAEYIDRISKGDLPPKITNDCYGDFNEIKNNLNRCIDVMSGLICESEGLVDQVQLGRLDSVAETTAFTGSWKTFLESINAMVQTFVGHIDAIPTPIMLVDKEFNIQFMNQFGAQIGNSTRKQLVHSKCYQYCKTDDCNTPKCGISRAISSGIAASSETKARPGGFSIDVSYSAAPVKNLKGEIVGGIQVVSDQTARKKAENIAKKVSIYQTKEVKKLFTVLKSMSGGDLTGSYETDCSDHDTQDIYDNFKTIETNLNGTLGSINGILAQISVAADQVNSGSGQVSDASQSLSQGATEQASSLEEISSSMQEIGAQTEQNAQYALKANELSGEAKIAASKGNQQMNELMDAVREIAESSKNISKIIKVIDEIAFQTNLLALNAAVEAARAGQHGKGFAVVAEEVRNLAARSAKAAKETAELIEEAIKKSERGARLATTTSGILNEIDRSANSVSDIVDDIARASGEQALGIHQINSSLNQVEQVTQQNTANAEESAAAAEQLSGQARLLKENLTRFKIKGHRNPEQGYLSQPTEYTAISAKTGEEMITPNQVIQLSDDEFGKY